MTVPWEARTIEERALFNPALLALVVWGSAVGFLRERDEPLPYPLMLPAATIALTDSVRKELPRQIRTSLIAWSASHPAVEARMRSTVRLLNRPTHDGLIFAMKSNLVSLDGLQLSPNMDTRVRVTQLRDEAAAIVNAAVFVGRWFARTGSTVTIYSVLGLGL